MRKSFFLFAMAWAVTVAAAGKRPITETDLLKFQWVADPQISPDGREVTYVLVTVNENEDRYDTSLWQVATTGSAAPRRLTAGPRDSSPRWSPDGRSLAFTRSAGEKDKPQIYLLSMSGGEARRLTDVPRGAGAALWSPNGKTIAFTSETTDEDLAERKAAKGKDPKEVEVEKEKKDKDERNKPRIVTRAVYRFNNQGWLDPAQRQSSTESDLFVFASGKAANRTADYAYEMGSNLAGDQRPPRGNLPGAIVWTPDGKSVILTTTEKARSNLVKVDVASRRIEPLTTGNHDVMAYTATSDASKFAVEIGDATHIGDVYLLDTRTKKLTQLTHVNDALFSQLDVSPPEEIWYDSFDGKKINAWIQKPPGFRP